MGIPVGGTEGGTLGIEAMAALCNPHRNEAISFSEAGREKCNSHAEFDAVDIAFPCEDSFSWFGSQTSLSRSMLVTTEKMAKEIVDHHGTSMRQITGADGAVFCFVLHWLRDWI